MYGLVQKYDIVTSQCTDVAHSGTGREVLVNKPLQTHNYSIVIIEQAAKSFAVATASTNISKIYPNQNTPGEKSSLKLVQVQLKHLQSFKENRP